MFFVTKREFTSIKPEVMQARAVMEEIRQVCSAIQKQVGQRFFLESTARQDQKLPDLNSFVDEYWLCVIAEQFKPGKLKTYPKR